MTISTTPLEALLPYIRTAAQTAEDGIVDNRHLLVSLYRSQPGAVNSAAAAAGVDPSRLRWVMGEWSGSVNRPESEYPLRLSPTLRSLLRSVTENADGSLPERISSAIFAGYSQDATSVTTFARLGLI